MEIYSCVKNVNQDMLFPHQMTPVLRSMKITTVFISKKLSKTFVIFVYLDIRWILEVLVFLFLRNQLMDASQLSMTFPTNVLCVPLVSTWKKILFAILFKMLTTTKKTEMKETTETVEIMEITETLQTMKRFWVWLSK